ncbi:hypothetical protein CMO89_04605 [Candidatus Woesearchaeota archaeon]|nr:hypothetical protein [Candidatus Woesearchaeota archaeon]|tara:strand:+ start:14197 stop:14406 length:210 start_codon:yes stop_codon:yes gene_type:complete
MKSCPKCKSKKIKLVDYTGIKCVVCEECGYDERDVYEETPDERTSQKAKGNYTPYRTGGKYRSSKIKNK